MPRSELWKYSSLMFSQRRDMKNSSFWQHICRLTCCSSLSGHQQKHAISMTYADLFSLNRFSGNSHRRSSPPQSHPTWPSGSLCSPQWSPSSPSTPSWPLSTSSCDPGDKMEEIVYFMWSILLTESLMSPERRVGPMTLTRTPQTLNNSKILQLFHLYSTSAKNQIFIPWLFCNGHAEAPLKLTFI